MQGAMLCNVGAAADTLNLHILASLNFARHTKYSFLSKEKKNLLTDGHAYRAHSFMYEIKSSIFMLESMATLALQGTNTEKNSPEKELCGHSPNFHIHVSVSDLYIFLRSICLFCCSKYVDRSWEYINRSHMTEEIGIEAAQFPEKEYIK